MMSRLRTESRVDEWPFQPWPSQRHPASVRWIDTPQETLTPFVRPARWLLALIAVVTLCVAASMGFAIAHLRPDQVGSHSPNVQLQGTGSTQPSDRGSPEG